MGHIRRLSAKGFKSFAQKTDLIFGDNYNTVIGPNGSGKCIVGDSQVQLANGEVLSIEELIEKKIGTLKTIEIDDGYICQGDGTEIICLNTETQKAEIKSIKNYVKRSSPPKLISLTTRSGKSLTCTPYHPLFILKNNSVVAARADELKNGVKIAVPKESCVQACIQVVSASNSQLQVQISKHSDIHWDEIISFREIDSQEKWVYDLCVDEHHNFVANNIFVHNSNVGDAICFVLGKSSAKGMRASKSSNLIYNGGKKKNPAKAAEVTIEFDNSKGIFPIEEKTVKLTRILKSNGSSKYQINGKVRTRQQVLEVLNKAHIDADGHNIILQGDVISFIESKPVEKRQIIEEIAGISLYEDKKNKCLKELEKVDGKLNETNIILSEREAHLKELKKERDQALKYKDLEKQIHNDKFTLTSLHSKEKEEKLHKIDVQKREVERKIEKNSSQIKDIKESIEQFKVRIRDINKEMDEKGEKEQILLRRTLEELKMTIARSQTRLETCQQEVKKISERKKQLVLNSKEVDESIKKIERESGEVEKRLKSLGEDEGNIEKSIEKFKKTHGVDDDLGKIFDAAEEEVEAKSLAITDLNLKKQELVRQEDQTAFTLKHVEEKLESLEGKSKKKEVQELKSKKKRFKDAEQELDDLFVKEASIIQELSQKRQIYIQKSNDLSRVQARQVHIKEKAHSDLAVRKIMELQEDVKGIHGTVAELGKVDSKYSLAMETAAGGRIQSIVVENDAVGQKCIEYLKEHKLGTAAFLPLNKIKRRPLDPRSQMVANKCHGFALDLLDFHPKYRDVFSFVFGSTVVVDDVSSARRLGIGRARMVSLDGDLFDHSGAMVGGYRSRKSGLGFMEKEIDSTVADLERELVKLSKEIGKEETFQKNFDEKLKQLRNEKSSLEGDIIRLEKSLHIEGENVEGLREEKNLLSDKLKDLRMEMKSVDLDVKKNSQDLEKLKVKKDEIKKKINDPQLTADLEALKNSKLRCKEEAVSLRAKLENLQVRIKTMLIPEKEKTEKIIRENEKDHGSFVEEISNLEELVKNRGKELKEKEAVEKKLYANFKGLIAQRNKFGDKVQAKEQGLVREEERLRSSEQRMHSISLDRAKVVAELEGLKKELSLYPGATMERGASRDQLKVRIKENEKMFSKIGNINLRALEVYEDIEREYKKVLEKVSVLNSEKDDVMLLLDEVEGKKKEVFMKTYNEITGNFKTIFNNLSKKGKAEVELENPEKPFEAGIDIQIKLDKNKALDLKSLSGGEKSLAALAFIFAIQEHNPSPFYLLDEVDAALDKRNSEILSTMIRDYSQKSQYIVISHNDSMISGADQIYGVSMQEGVSKIVSLKV